MYCTQYNRTTCTTAHRVSKCQQLKQLLHCVLNGATELLPCSFLRRAVHSYLSYGLIIAFIVQYGELRSESWAVLSYTGGVEKLTVTNSSTPLAKTARDKNADYDVRWCHVFWQIGATHVRSLPPVFLGIRASSASKREAVGSFEMHEDSNLCTHILENHK